MHKYIVDTEFAVANLLKLITAEEEQLEPLVAHLGSMEAQLRVHRWDFESSDLNDDFSDAYVMAAFGRMARAAQAVEALEKQVAELQASIGAHQQATQAIAGGVLQIAKQGISLVHGRKARAPEGRKIGSLPIRDIIWEARNQALHFEEGRFNNPVIEVFEALERERGTEFSLAVHGRKSRAKQVLRLLGWSSFEDYARDMSELLS